MVWHSSVVKTSSSIVILGSCHKDPSSLDPIFPAVVHSSQRVNIYLGEICKWHYEGSTKNKNDEYSPHLILFHDHVARLGKARKMWEKERKKYYKYLKK